MKKMVILSIVAAFAIVAAASFAFAAPTPTAPNPMNCQQGQPITLTDAQKQELAPLYDKMLETHKQLLQKYVEYGKLTQEQADQRLALMKDHMQNCSQNGGCGMMDQGMGHGKMGTNHGMMMGNGAGCCGQQQAAPAK